MTPLRPNPRYRRGQMVYQMRRPHDERGRHVRQRDASRLTSKSKATTRRSSISVTRNGSGYYPFNRRATRGACLGSPRSSDAPSHWWLDPCHMQTGHPRWVRIPAHSQGEDVNTSQTLAQLLSALKTAACTFSRKPGYIPYVPTTMSAMDYAPSQGVATPRCHP